MPPDMETVYEPLSPIKDAKIEFVLARMEEGKTQKVLVTHKGDEYIYVVKGILEVRIESNAHILKEGNSISFKPKKANSKNKSRRSKPTSDKPSK